MKHFLFILPALLLFVACQSETSSTEEIEVAKAINANFVEPIPIEEEASESAPIPLYKSHDYGMTWQKAEEDLPTDIQIFRMGETTKEIILATGNYGILVKEKGAKEWKNTSEGLPEKQVNALYTIEDEMYVGVYQSGIYKLDRQKNTWTKLNFDLADLRVQSIVKVKGQLMAGTDTGIFRLLSSKQKWEKIFGDMQIKSLNEYDGKLVAATPKGAVFSEDHGANWTWITEGENFNRAAMVQGKIILMNSFRGFYASKDWGKTWDESSFGLPNHTRLNNIVEVDRYLIMSTNKGIYRSMDGGMSWFAAFSPEEQMFMGLLVSDNVIYLAKSMGGC